MHHKTIAELAHELKNRSVSSVELTEHFLNRIKKFNPDLNCFITITEKQALEQARLADGILQKGEANPLTGIPIAHKDIFCTQGIKTSCASKILDNFIAPYDATVVTKLKQANTVLLGKTNMDEFAMGSSNENSYYGSVKNPWALDYIPGGSSGGSAAAVAARLIPAATGTDTGGSIRQPAAMCGITGLKPTYGRVSRWGMIAFASSLDQAGPMTQTAEDAALILNAIAGHDTKDSTCINREVPNYCAALNNKLSGLTIGLPKEHYAQGLDPKIAAAIDEMVRVLEKQGIKFKSVSLPHTTDPAISAYYVIAPAECSSNLARYDGVRFGYRCKNPKNIEDLYKRSRSEAFGKEVQRRIIIGTYVLSAGYYDAYYLKAQQVRRIIRDEFLNVFKEVDLILSPTTPTPAFKLGEKITDPVSMYLSDIYTIAVNLAGLPGISLPVGFSGHLPIGAQFIGKHFDEALLLNVAHQFQKITDWHKKLPQNYECAVSKIEL